VKAYIVPKDGYTLDESELKEFCRLNLAAFKVPRKIEFRTDLPKSLTGKVIRRLLVEEEKARQKPLAKEVG
jgi:long-chain acyl-CoA synthetase